MAESNVDVLLVGAGVMSATLATMLAQLDPTMRIVMVERLDEVARESTDGWNNAGTGHAGYCELNYTSQNAHGDISIDRALSINAAFEVSLQYWSYLVEQGLLPEPTRFINPTPHESFVWGEKDVDFLRKRHQLLSRHHLFKDMVFSDDPTQIAQWMPLVMQDRTPGQPVAATRVDYGSDVDFGSLTRHMIDALQAHDHFELRLGHAVKGLKRDAHGRWQVQLQGRKNRKRQTLHADFVFLGAGGGALPLLQKSGIPEAKGYGGFPVSGQWLVCHNQEIVRQHRSKVYGKAPVGAPPMSVPHLDTRVIDGEPALLFGPYAGFTTKFLKQGSLLDLAASVKTSNLKPILKAGMHNMDLTRYLVSEVFQSHKTRIESLRDFYPVAKHKDWKLAKAGQRVQIIKQCNEKGGKLEFGTEIVATRDGSLAALLGASPGASTSVQAMIEVLERCFGDRIKSAAWRSKMQQMVPSYGKSLVQDAGLAGEVRSRTLATLKLA